MKHILKILALLLLLGLVKLTLGQKVTHDLRQQRLLQEPLRLGVGENLGQAGLAASLGGLRGLAACMFQLRAHVEFTNVNWAKVDSLYKLVTRLQPRNFRYWEEASWHMAYNAASYYLYSEDLKPALRGQFYHDHVKRGIAILQEGLVFLPNHPRLWEKLAEIYARRAYQYKDAGDAYWQSFQNGGLNYTERFAAYSYAQSSDPESWKKGYAILKRLHDANQSTPGLIEHLKSLEQNLRMPIEQRILDASPVRRVPAPQSGPKR